MKIRKRVAVVAAVILLLLWFGWIIFQKNVCQRLQCVSFTDKQKYILRDVYKESTNSFQALYQTNDLSLRVDIESGISEGDADTKTNGLMAQLKSLYVPARSPYPDVVSYKIVCSDEFVPKFSTDSIKGIKIIHFSAYMTNRLTYGVCDSESATHKGTMALFYCPNQRQLVRLEWIIPKASKDNTPVREPALIQSIQCLR